MTEECTRRAGNRMMQPATGEPISFSRPGFLHVLPEFMVAHQFLVAHDFMVAEELMITYEFMIARSFRLT